MKYKKSSLMLLLLLVGAITLSAKREQIPVPITENLEESPTIRVPSSSRLECFYDSDAKELCLYLINTTGTTSVVLTNLITGETHNDSFIGNGLFYIPFSGTNGFWHISITLQNGTEYVGEIIL